MGVYGMKRRCWVHDYCAPTYYMITIVTHPRRGCLGELVLGTGVEPAMSASVVPSPIGEVVQEAWARTSAVYAHIEACESVVMPDHFHGILRVTERLERHVGHVIKAFKVVCEKECRSKGLLLPPNLGQHPPPNLGQHPPPNLGLLQGPVSAAAPAAEYSSLWEEGYNDTILLRRGQLRRMSDYIVDNPRRLALKRAHPDLFTVCANLRVTASMTMPGIGNRFLLDRPVKRQVQVSRRISPQVLKAIKEELLYASEHGAVLVSPCISDGEREVAHAALDAGLPLIVLVENGFKPSCRPPGKYLDACANGRLLMLAPFPYHRERRTITRAQCLSLNDLAQEIARDD